MRCRPKRHAADDDLNTKLDCMIPPMHEGHKRLLHIYEIVTFFRLLNWVHHYLAVGKLHLLSGLFQGYLCSRSKYSPESFYHVDMEQIRYRHPYASARQKVTFSWVTDLLWIGFKRPIGFEDLGRYGNCCMSLSR